MGQLNLIGSQEGMFNYPRWRPPNQFDADLRDHHGITISETFEVGDGARNKGQSLRAMIQGGRDRSHVNFDKHYDDFSRSANPVYCAGAANNDGSEISGSWDIPGHWSGTFLMIRAKPEIATAEEKISESAR